MKRILAVVLMLAAAAASPLHAVIVIPVSFEQLVDEAAAVVFARVSDVRGQ